MARTHEGTQTHHNKWTVTEVPVWVVVSLTGLYILSCTLFLLLNSLSGPDEVNCLAAWVKSRKSLKRKAQSSLLLFTLYIWREKVWCNQTHRNKQYLHCSPKSLRNDKRSPFPTIKRHLTSLCHHVSCGGLTTITNNNLNLVMFSILLFLHGESATLSVSFAEILKLMAAKNAQKWVTHLPAVQQFPGAQTVGKGVKNQMLQDAEQFRIMLWNYIFFLDTS